MTTRYVQPGKVLDHIAAAAITSGDLVGVGPLLGVALSDIANGATGSIQVSGVFSLPKATGALSAGALINYDASADNMTGSATAATGDITGAAVVTTAAASGDANVNAILLPGSGVLS